MSEIIRLNYDDSVKTTTFKLTGRLIMLASKPIELDENWMEAGRCYDQPNLSPIFFPEYHTQDYIETEIEPICSPCPVRAECVEYALQFGNRFVGYWGGLNQKDRAKIYQQRQ